MWVCCVTKRPVFQLDRHKQVQEIRNDGVDEGHNLCYHKGSFPRRVGLNETLYKKSIYDLDGQVVFSANSYAKDIEGITRIVLLKVEFPTEMSMD